MNKTAKLLVCSIATTTLLAAGGSFAQTMPMKSGNSAMPMKPDDSMKSGGMSSGEMKMSHKQMKMMKKCMAMGHDKMMANAKCEAMADKHPDMMTSDGMKK